MAPKGGTKQGNQHQQRRRAGDARSSADWCCKLCLGPDGKAYRNCGDRKACNKCHVDKGTCFLCKAAKAPGSPPSSNLAERQAKLQRQELSKQLRVRDEEIHKLKRQLAGSAANEQQRKEPVGRVEGSLQPSSADLPATKTLQRQIQQLKGLDPVFRETLCASKGGYQTFLGELEGRLEAEYAKQREQKPISQQKASAEAHLKKMQRAKSEADCKLEELQSAHAELAAKIAMQMAAVSEADAKLQKARLEVAAVTEKATAELRGASCSDSAVTASAVTGWFGKLPTDVVEHLQAQHAMQTIMELMEKLDKAKQVVEAEAAQPLPSAPDMEGPEASAAAAAALPSAAGADYMDDDFLEALAEAAAGEADDDDDGASKAQQVAATKARLKAKRGELARKMLVKRTVKA